ncbi:MAG: hypothetical protein C0614_09470 [Desulfuromonas sp.]|nr:MAG: hypothetical protein C0614_09470 [Desulfuromonas sp.]
MESRIAEAVKLPHQPVAILWGDNKPESARMFKGKAWGCTLWLLAAAAKGRLAACSRNNFGCFGGGTGIGFGDQYRNFPGGADGFCRFLSTGNAGDPQGEAIAEGMKPFAPAEFIDEYLQGEGYLKSPKDVGAFIEEIPILDIEAEYVLFKPLSEVDPHCEEPVSVVFFSDPDRFAALGVLANYSFPGNDNVIFPFAAGCQAIGIYSYREAASSRPRAVAGPMDLSARLYLRGQFGEDVMSLSIPWSMFLTMEDNVAGSFLERHTWHQLLKTKS